MAKCQICNQVSPLISRGIGVCLDCIRYKPDEALQVADRIHKEIRNSFGLPAKPPRNKDGLLCNQCPNQCKIPTNQKGYCGIVENKEGKLERSGGTKEKGILEWYYDQLPTNWSHGGSVLDVQEQDTQNTPITLMQKKNMRI